MHLAPLAVVLVLALPFAISLAAPDAALSVPRSFLARTSDARTSRARCPSAAVIGTSNTPAELAAHYDMTPLLEKGDEGQGVRVAVVEFEPDQRSDIAAYQSCQDSHAKVNYIPVGEPKVVFARGGSEATLDIETIIGLAPKATIDVYQAPKNATPAQIIAVYKTIVTRNVDSVISISWGECELDTSSSVVAAERKLFALAYEQGQTIYAAAGDSGLTGCGGTQHALRSTDDPASQPDVIGVGGTSISGAHTETVWNRGTGIGGGGISLNVAMPRFQHAVAGDSRACGAQLKSFCRQVPDVSADADPYTGYVIYLDGRWQGGWGGTSAATPLWAAATALIGASPGCEGSGRVFHMLQRLYRLAASPAGRTALYDVTRGSNGHKATKGYDMASGLGTPKVANLAGELCGRAA